MQEAIEQKKESRRDYMKRWRAENRDRIGAYKKTWVADHKEECAAQQRAYHAVYRNLPDKQFETWVRNLHRNYRLSPEGFNALWAKQSGKCAVCKVAMLPRGRTTDGACVDHNHETGEVRGLLCRACNHGIGNLKDSPDVLRSAIEYLEANGHYSKHVIQE